MDYAGLIQALQGKQQQAYDSNPYLQAGLAVQKAPIPFQEMKPWEAIVTGLAQGLGGGFLAGKGQKQASTQAQEQNQRLIEALSSADPVAALRQDPNMTDIAAQMQLQQMATKQKNQSTLAQKMQELELGNRYAVERAQAMAPIDINKARSIEGIKAAQKLKSSLPNAIGAPGASQLDPKAILEDQKMALKQASEIEEKARSALETGKTVMAYADEAYTGVGAGLRKGTAKYLDSMGLSSDNMRDRLRATAALESQFPAFQQLYRTQGAQSEKEQEVIKLASPGVTRTAEENETLGRLVVAKAKQSLEYAEFTKRWLAEKGSTTGLSPAWQAYRDQSPLVTETKDGGTKVNDPKGNWEAFLNEDSGGSNLPMPGESKAQYRQRMRKQGM